MSGRVLFHVQHLLGSGHLRRAAALGEAMAAAGLDVSEARNGFKPGTRVATLRSGTGGLPTLLIQPAPRTSADQASRADDGPAARKET